MYFKRLELIGFKSFADKTVIQFEPGVTAIVGPNGCGKSNISDAIRWVLGEQSARSLRGSEMLDIIFNGSAVKEPLNLAEVSLVLSNESRILAIEYDEVTISRRLYRSGESEYLINKNPVRLKDVHELLMGTGIGTENYSVIEQGQMDLILNSKPEDRRVIFEEAAGITKYKSQKKEALRKLEQTEQNLVRINDIVQEVKRQIGIIERQAKKAESYKVEFEKLKTLELLVASREFLILEQNRQEKEEALSVLQKEEASALSEVKELESQLAQQRERLDALDESMKGFTAQEMSLSSRIRQNQDRILMNRERIGELLERKENLLGQIRQAEKRLEEIKQETERLNEELASAKAEQQLEQPSFESMEGEFKSLDEIFQHAYRELESVRHRRAQIAEEKNRSNAQQSRTESERSGVEARLGRLKQEEEAYRQEVSEIESGDLFAAAQHLGDENPIKKLELKLRGFRERLFGLFQSWIQKTGGQIGADEESAMDSELRNFSQEVYQIQGAAANLEASKRHTDEARRKIEQKLFRISEEISSLQAQEVVLLERKNGLEVNFNLLISEEAALNVVEMAAQETMQQKTAEREQTLVHVTEARSRQANFAARCQKIEKDLHWIIDSKRSAEELLTSVHHEIEESAKRKIHLEEESSRLETESAELSGQRDELLRQTEGKRRERETVHEALKLLERQVHEKNEFLRAASEKAHAFAMSGAQIRFEVDRLKERIFNAYQADLAMPESTDGGQISLEDAKEQIRVQREKLTRLGPVSLVAIEEHQEMKARYEFLTQQEQDLLKAKEDLHKAILKINRTTRELFAETFEKIRKHFSDYYKLLFGGGAADLILLDEQDVLESGIDIMVRPPGKKLQNMTLLSGGEKALTSIALLFALFKVKPSPFCVLDEIDAPLDEANIDRFLKVLKDFIVESQFILVTHNKRTMSLANILYGITMMENGVSRVVSVKLSGQISEASGEITNSDLVTTKEEGAVLL